MVLLYNRCQDPRGLLGFQVWRGLQDPLVQMVNREIQGRMGKRDNKVLEGLPGVKVALEPKDRRENAGRASQGQEGPQDFLALQDPAVVTALHLWTWRGLDLQTKTNGVPVVLRALLALLAVLGHP